MRQALAEKRTSENGSPSFTQFTYNRQIELAESSSEALPHLKAFVDNQKDPAARLASAQWLCENQYAMSTAITALTELSFDDNQQVAFKALSELDSLENHQALDALRGIFKWGPTEDVRSRAGQFMKRHLLKGEILHLPPVTREALVWPEMHSPPLPNIFPRMPASEPTSAVHVPARETHQPANRRDVAPVGNTNVPAPASATASPKGGALSNLQASLAKGIHSLPFLSKLLNNSRFHTWSLPLFVLFFTTIAELFITFTTPLAAMGLHVTVMFVLLYNVLHTVNPIRRRLQTVLLLIPLTRILFLALPLANLSRVNSSLAISIPLFIAIMMIIWQESWSREELGFTFNHLPLQAVTAISGLGFGLLQYNLISPEPFTTEPTWQAALVPALILMVSTGYLQELMFRGLLQNAALPILGHWPSILFVASLFAVLNMSYLLTVGVGVSLALGILLVFLIGLIFGLVVAHSRSIVGVTLAHGIMNITLFLIWPYWIG